MWLDPLIWTLVAGSFVLAMILIRVSLWYATRRGLIDKPGYRRSHSTPTPRGAGLGMVLAAVPAMVWVLWQWPLAPWTMAEAIALPLAVLLVLAIGWLDDHAHIAAWARILVHLAAAVLLAFVVLEDGDMPAAVRIVAGVALAVAITWSINLHNFMDGIDGLLGLQCFVYFSLLGLFGIWVGAPSWAALAWVLAAVCAAFLVFNLPPARIFMGDGGSGTLGLLVAGLPVLLWRQVPEVLWPALILCSGFVVDATLTLLWRIARGRRWYTAHREHLYQWLVRSGRSHAWTGCLYMSWNLLIAAPVAWAATVRPEYGLVLTAVVYGAGALLWWRLRHGLIRRLRASGAAHVA